MPIKVTEKTKNSGYLKPLAIGALAGYSAKWLIPVASWEKNEYYDYYISNVKRNAKRVKDEYISDLKNQGLIDKKTEKAVRKLSYKTIKNLNKKIKSQVISVIFQANDAARVFKNQGYKNAKFLLKRIRPTATFTFLGAGIALCFKI